MSLFSDIVSNLASATESVMGVDIVYTPSVGDPILLCATVGKTDFVVDGGNGVATEYTSRDYLVRASSMVDVSGAPVTPNRGDTITEGGFTYKVMIDSAVSPPWKWSDSTRTRMRIHTKQTGVPE